MMVVVWEGVVQWWAHSRWSGFTGFATDIESSTPAAILQQELYVQRVASMALLSSCVVMAAPGTFFLTLWRTNGANIKDSNQQLVIMLPYLLLWIQAMLWACYAYMNNLNQEDRGGTGEVQSPLFSHEIFCKIFPFTSLFGANFGQHLRWYADLDCGFLFFCFVSMTWGLGRFVV